MQDNSFCEYLDWDSNFFGLRIGRITVNRLNREIAESVTRWVESENIDCIYFLGDSDDAATVRLAESCQFNLVDIRITLERTLSHGEGESRFAGAPVRHCIPDDIEALKAIARMSHHDSRFFYDSNFSVPRCRSLYETWIEKSCNGFADAVLVPLVDGRPAGYSSCHLSGPQGGTIGLFAIGSDFRGRGLGEELVHQSLEWFSRQNVGKVSVATQGRNHRAQQLYQNCGFLTSSVRLWYHWWVKRKA